MSTKNHIIASMMNPVIVILSFVTLTIIYWMIRDRIRNSKRNDLLKGLKQFPIRNFPLIGQAWYMTGSLKSETIHINTMR